MASTLVLATILIGMISSTSAYDFYVGGRDGWDPNPKESYSNWSSRMRFQINDKLVFKYEKDQDSVLVVKKEDYDSCNSSSPTQKLEGGDSTFRFARTGPFYFISGVSDRCAKGEKLIVVVMAPRNKKPLPPPPLLPPSASPPLISPSPAPAKLPSSPSPSSKAPTPTPSSSPSASPAMAPTPSPSSSPSASPAMTPTLSPSSATSPSPSSSEVSPAEGPSSGNGESATSPPKKSSAASALTASSVTVGLFALVLNRAILG